MMRKTILTAAAAAMLSLAGASAAHAGCYRMGLTGYHLYRYCVGPRFLYPHRRHCAWRHHHRVCWMR